MRNGANCTIAPLLSCRLGAESLRLCGAWQKVGLHPVWLIFALFAFSYLFGFVGTLMAVPVAAAIGVLVRHALTLYLDSSVYRGDAPKLESS